MRLSTQLSVLSMMVVLTGIIGITQAIQILSGSTMGLGVSGCTGLHSILWSHSLQSEISFDRLVTISENAHQVSDN